MFLIELWGELCVGPRWKGAARGRKCYKTHLSQADPLSLSQTLAPSQLTNSAVNEIPIKVVADFADKKRSEEGYGREREKKSKNNIQMGNLHRNRTKAEKRKRPQPDWMWKKRKEAEKEAANMRKLTEWWNGII